MTNRRMCPNCRAFAEPGDRVCQYCGVKLGMKAIDKRSPQDILGGLIPAAHFLTSMILLVNCCLFAATVIASMNSGNSGLFDGPNGRVLLAFGAKHYGLVKAGQWWRLVTAGFLHGNILHIAMNSWAMMSLGGMVEENFGARRFVTIYFVATVAGFAASTWWSRSLSVGASAGIFGLIGAMIAYGILARSHLGEGIKQQFIQMAVYSTLMGFVMNMPIDNAAHFGGLAGGFAVAYIAGTPRLVDDWREKLWYSVSAVCLGLTAISFLRMFAGLR